MKPLEIPESLREAYKEYKQFSDSYSALNKVYENINTIRSVNLKKPQSKAMIEAAIANLNTYKDGVLRENFDFNKAFKRAREKLTIELNKLFLGTILLVEYDPYPAGSNTHYSSIYKFTTSPELTDTTLVRIRSNLVGYGNGKFSMVPYHTFEIYLETLMEKPYSNTHNYVITEDEFKKMTKEGFEQVNSEFFNG
jgi:hypothetical protein